MANSITNFALREGNAQPQQQPAIIQPQQQDPPGNQQSQTSILPQLNPETPGQNTAGQGINKNEQTILEVKIL